ncbi:MAG TPA: CBS domain-containing protein [Candidatus Binatia bacterium]|nr:CBS domain-containing protein [Candidatus Binatia bacterium]
MDEWTIEEDLCLLGGGEQQVRRILDQQMLQEPIRRLEPHAPLAVAPTATLAEAVRLMREHRVGCLLVVDGERLTGIVTERDFLLKLDRPDADRPVAELMTQDPEVLTPDDPIVYALNKMSVGGFRHVPLVDAARRPVGVVSVKDIIDYLADLFASDVLTVPPDPARAQAWRERDGG